MTVRRYTVALLSVSGSRRLARRTVARRATNAWRMRRASALSIAHSRSCGERQILLDQFHLMGPAAFVGGERLGAPLDRNSIEARLGYGQHRPRRNFLQLKHHQRARFLGVIDARIDGVRMPPE